jgi:hypothetical protein
MDISVTPTRCEPVDKRPSSTADRPAIKNILTVLRSSGARMSKLLKADGTIEPYSRAKHFDVELVEVAGIEDVAALVTKLETDPYACIIRGAPVGPDRRGVRRQGANFADQPLNALMIDVDDAWIPPKTAPDPVRRPEDCALLYIAQCLPEVFHDAAFFWQLSNSAGVTGKEGQLRIHLWFWLDRPYDSATLNAWAAAEGLKIDRSIFNPVQIHYTSAPALGAGVPDPVPVRSGYCEADDDADSRVPLRIDVEALNIRAPAPSRNGEDIEADDSVADWLLENWTVYGEIDAGLLILCPFDSGHSSGTPGDSSTVYLPAGTRGFRNGHFKCLHSSCAGRSDTDFLAAMDYPMFGAIRIDPTGAVGSAPGWVADLNKQFAVVTSGADVRVARLSRDGSIRFLRKVDFFDLLANETVLIGTRHRPMGEAWFKHPARRQHTSPGVVFRPGEEVGPGGLNLWRGMGVEPRAGDWSLMHAHLLRLICGGDARSFSWLLGFLATCVQRLDQPVGVVLVLRSEQGAGKGIFVDNFGRLFGQHYVHFTDADQFTGRFNNPLGTACCVFLDEAVFSRDPKQAAKLKGMITESTLTIERKFCDPIAVQNRLRIFIATNERHAAPVEVSDRRYAVFDVSADRCGDRPYFTALVNQMDNGGREAMLFDLLAYDLSEFEIREIPATSARTEQKISSLRGVEAFLYDVLAEAHFRIGRASSSWADGGLGVCEIPKATAYDCYKEFAANQKEYRPLPQHNWAQEVIRIMGPTVGTQRPNKSPRQFVFAPLAICRARFGSYINEPDIAWDSAEGS